MPPTDYGSPNLILGEFMEQKKRSDCLLLCKGHLRYIAKSSRSIGLPVAKAVVVTSQGDRPTKNTYINKGLDGIHKAIITNARVIIDEFKI